MNRPPIAAYTPIARPRSSGRNASVTSTAAAGIISTLPSPSITLPASRTGRFGAYGAGDRTADEHEHADDKHPHPAKRVAEPASNRQPRSQGQTIDRDDPLQSALIDRKRLLNPRQGDADACRVDHHHRHRAAQGQQGPPSAQLRYHEAHSNDEVVALTVRRQRVGERPPPITSSHPNTTALLPSGMIWRRYAKYSRNEHKTPKSSIRGRAARRAMQRFLAQRMSPFRNARRNVSITPR